MDDDDSGPKTPRVSASPLDWLKEAMRLSRVAEDAARHYRKRIAVIDIRAARRCETIAELALALAESFDSWTRIEPTDAERAAQIDALAGLNEMASVLVERVGLSLREGC